MEDSFVRTDEQYGDGVMLDTYSGYGLAAAREGSDGKVYKKWAFPQGRNREAAAKAIPVKVHLGDTAQAAIATLEYMIALIKGSGQAVPAEPEPGPVGGEFDDIPF